MKFKLLAVLAIAGICAGSLAIADNSNRMSADDSVSQDSQPAMNLADNTPTGGTTDNSTSGTTDNAGSSQDSLPPSNSDDSTDTSTGDDDY